MKYEDNSVSKYLCEVKRKAMRPSRRLTDLFYVVIGVRGDPQ